MRLKVFNLTCFYYRWFLVVGAFFRVTGTFVPRKIDFVPWNFRSQEPSFPGTFVPMTDIKGELSFPNIGYYCLVMILKGNLNS